ncbi:MAG: HAD-IC family P-type ATPase [Atopobiaceae bacterium]
MGQTPADLDDRRGAHRPDASQVDDDLTSRGLSSEEVADRVRRGLVNANSDIRTKSVKRIIAEHTLTTFNLVNVVLAALVAFTGQYRNMAFMVIVLANLLVGVVQELRAKRMVDRLTILTAKAVKVRREGHVEEVGVHDLVLDDVIELSRGDQVPADSTVLQGQPRMNESLLTGESATVPKQAGDLLYSGSFVDSGYVVARVQKVGADGYAARISAEAKQLKAVRSEILTTLRTIIGLATRLMVPLGIGLFLRTYFSDGATLNGAILTTVAALVGMIPQGLILLTSSVLAIATIRLGRRNVLVQQSYCVETLARVDTLCLDKTGTITSGAMEVDDVRAVGENASEDVSDQARRRVLQAALSVVRANEGDVNATARAVMERAVAEGVEALDAVVAVPFSSERKLSGCTVADGRSFVMGASQFVLHEDYQSYESVARSFDPLDRVVVVAQVDGFSTEGAPLGRPRVLGFVGIRDQIRPTASRTIAFFRQAGVEPKVISGDDAATVAAIARRVGVPGADSYVDATTLDTPEKLRKAATTCAVFGRVTPQQKRSLVRALQQEGRTVAMTGDGVNDVLALREADCSVAMASGSAAARNVAEIVLVDNDFAHMPEVVAEGRRSINNLQRSASLFLVKTVFSAALAFICIFMPPYPFVPVQMSLLSAAVIGVPSFVLALEPNHELVRGSFLVNVLSKSLPASVTEVVALGICLWLGRMTHMEFAQISTACLFLALVVGFALIVRISLPLTPLRVALLCFIMAMVTFASIWMAGFFEIARLEGSVAVLLLVGAVASVVLFNVLYDRFGRYAQGDGSMFARLVSRLEARDARKRSSV